MLVRLAVYVLVSAFAAIGVVLSVVRPALRAWRDRQRGRLNADHTCAYAECGQYVDPTHRDSLFENGQWMHRRCRAKLLS